MDCAWRLTPKETDLCIALSLSGSTPAQILTHLKKLNSDNCSTATTIYNFMVKYRLKQLAGRTRIDDDQQLQKGLAEVFPEATNILCAFHIKRNVCANFKTSINKDTPEDLGKIKGEWDALWMSESYAMYKINLDCVERSWVKKYPKWISYVKTQWLARKEKFVCAWTNQIKHFGNRTINRVEGEHAILKRFLKWIKIRASFEKSKNIGLHEHHRSPYIQHLVYHVSKTVLDFISREIKSLSKRDPGRCQHLIRKTHGFPCACEISKCYHMDQTFRLDCIDGHWKKLSLLLVHNKVVGDVDWESVVEKIKSKYKGSTQEQRQEMLDNLHEIANQRSTLM
ncbi:hypothetical protein MKX03_007616 [Papaver bracteatum]|nr:hypothetical protein MKX03_007616 [Papaver bracteatum]